MDLRVSRETGRRFDQSHCPAIMEKRKNLQKAEKKGWGGGTALVFHKEERKKTLPDWRDGGKR